MKAIPVFLKSVYAFLLLALLACAGSDAPPAPEPEPAEDDVTDVLLIGNSHTYYNSGIGFHLARFLQEDRPASDFNIAVQAIGGYSLSDHLQETSTQDLIASRKWDMVVLQENTSVAAMVPDELYHSVWGMINAINDDQTEILLYMTWAYADQPAMFNALQAAYNKAGDDTGARIIPVGEAYEQLLAANPLEIELYHTDGVHASLEGTFMASAMFLEVLFGLNPVTFEYDAGLDAATADFLKQAAHAAVTGSSAP